MAFRDEILGVCACPRQAQRRTVQRVHGFLYPATEEGLCVFTLSHGSRGNCHNQNVSVDAPC
jgi:hypothetical protein